MRHTIYSISFLLIFFVASAQADDNAKKDLVDHLKAVPPFTADVIQVNDQNGIAVAEGQFAFNPPGKFVLEYDKNQFPLKFISDGKWIAQVDQQMDQTSFVHMDDFPLSPIFFQPEKLLKEKVEVELATDTPEEISYHLKFQDVPDLLLVRFNKQDHALAGWQLVHADDSTTHVRLNDRQINPAFDEKKFLLPGARF